MIQAAIATSGIPIFAKSRNVLAKTTLLLALLYPDQGNLRDKAAGLRAVGYPLASFAVPLLWWVVWFDDWTHFMNTGLLAEYFAFLSRSSERVFAYAATLGDLALGTAGAVVAGVVLQRVWQRGRLLDSAALPAPPARAESAPPAPRTMSPVDDASRSHRPATATTGGGRS